MATTAPQENPVWHILKHIGHGVKVAVTTVGHGIAKIAGGGDEEKGKAVLKAFAQAAEDFAKTELGKLALQNAYAVLNLSNLSDTEKRQAVFDATAADAKARGVEYTNWILNSGIELLVGIVKNYYTPTATPLADPPPTATPLADPPPTVG